MLVIFNGYLKILGWCWKCQLELTVFILIHVAFSVTVHIWTVNFKCCREVRSIQIWSQTRVSEGMVAPPKSFVLGLKTEVSADFQMIHHWTPE